MHDDTLTWNVVATSNIVVLDVPLSFLSPWRVIWMKDLTNIEGLHMVLV